MVSEQNMQICRGWEPEAIRGKQLLVNIGLLVPTFGSVLIIIRLPHLRSHLLPASCNWREVGIERIYWS